MSIFFYLPATKSTKNLKFCGTKIECHHIIQEAEGGTDTFENCMPVCFDCHSDMRSYDFKHPKGTKYSPEELRLHRDRWYEKVASGGGANALPMHQDVDRAVFAAFQQAVPYYPTLDYLKGRNFAGFGFQRSALERIFRYSYYSDRPEYEFLDPEMEAVRAEFAAAARGFDRAIAGNTFPISSDLYSVPQDWELTEPDRFDKAVEEIHAAADAVEKAYANMVRVARRRLGGSGRN